MEMLKSMKQEMKERDDQLKLQLQLRDEYMEVELKRRDQNLEDALKQRDEEWRAELEKRDQNWLKSLAHWKQSFRLMTYEQVNSITLLESLAKRLRELTIKQCKDLKVGYEDSLKQEESVITTNQNFILCALHSGPSRCNKLPNTIL